jgi:Ca-activated chloride channel family protein
MIMDFSEAHFDAPTNLWLLPIALIGLAVLFLLSHLARKQQLATFVDRTLLGRLLASHSPARRTIKVALIFFAVVFLVVALARPQWGEQRDTTVAAGEDTVFVLDTSKSMLAADVRPNRLERAKIAIEDYLRRHGHGRVGLVVFAGQAFLQCPLTLDYDAFADTLRSVDVNAVPVPGSDVGRAIDEASRALEKNEGRKIVVLITDGEDLEGRGVRQAEALAKKGVTIFTVGVGTAAGSIIQVPAETSGQQPLRDKEGRPVVSRLDENTLRQISEKTGGSYQPLGVIGDGMDKVRAAISSDGKKKRDLLIRTHGIDRYRWPLGVALFVLLVEPLLRTRVRSPRAAPSA